jgi:hypothetical protein
MQTRVSDGGWRRGQSAREGEAMRNEVRGVRGVLAGLYEGSWARGRASWPRNPATCASAHASVHDERGGGRTDRQAHGTEREERGMRGNSSATGGPGPRDRERGSARGRKLAPTGWPHWAASEGGRARGRTTADRRGPPVRRRRRVAWLGLVGRLGCFLFSFFSEFSNSFSISFSIGFSNPNSN